MRFAQIILVPTILFTIIGLLGYYSIKPSNYLVAAIIIISGYISTIALMYNHEAHIEHYPKCEEHNEYPCFEKECVGHMKEVKESLLEQIKNYFKQIN